MSDTATTNATTAPGGPEPGTGAPTGGSVGSGHTTTAALRRRPRLPRTRRRWQRDLWNSTPSSVLMDEATRLTQQRDRRRAIRLLAVAAATTEDHTHRHGVLAQLAVTSADAGRHNVSADALFELQQIEPRTADLWVTFAEVALARGNYSHADAAARSALELEPENQGAWAVLAAGYAGLGWFDAARTCLDRTDRTALTNLQRWRIGRAVNRWAMAKTRWVVTAAISAIVVGVLAVAIAVSVPFVTREFRLRALRSVDVSKPFEELATEAWRVEHRLRLSHAATVMLSVLAFALTTILA